MDNTQKQPTKTTLKHQIQKTLTTIALWPLYFMPKPHGHTEGATGFAILLWISGWLAALLTLGLIGNILYK